jgi:hypothetical protein
MSTHPHGPADPANPQKSRHTVAVLHDAQHRPTKQLELVQRDALRVIEWLGESPLRTITSEELRKWVKGQVPQWTPGYWKVVKEYVQDGLADRVSESSTTTKARLLALVDRLLPECSNYVTGSGGAGEGTIFLTDPVTGEHLKKIEHGAIQGYLKFYAELTGLLSEKHQHVHLHGAMASGDLSEVPEAELIAAMNAKPVTQEQ